MSSPLAVEHYQRRDWRIVHVLTGLGLVRLIRNEREARALLARLLALPGLDWTIETVTVPAVAGDFGYTRPESTTQRLADRHTRRLILDVRMWVLDPANTPDPIEIEAGYAALATARRIGAA